MANSFLIVVYILFITLVTVCLFSNIDYLYKKLLLTFHHFGEYIREEETGEKEKYKDYRYCILVLLAKIMKADGDTMECELDRVKSTIRRYYKTKEEQYEAFNTFKSILDDNNYFSIWSSLNTQFDYTAKSELIMELLAVAYSDNNLKYAEEKEILHIVSQLRITSDEYKSIYSIFIEKYNKGFYS